MSGICAWKTGLPKLSENGCEYDGLARLAGARERFLGRAARVLDRQRRRRVDAADAGLGREASSRSSRRCRTRRSFSQIRLLISGCSRVKPAAWTQEGVAVERAGDELARHPHQLLVVLDQAQAHLLLGDLGVAPDRLLLALELLVAQVPERRDDRRQEEQHRQRAGRASRSDPGAPPTGAATSGRRRARPRCGSGAPAAEAAASAIIGDVAP